LYSGIGGFEIGIQNVIGKENLDIIFSSEIDDYAAKSYELYFKHKSSGDITKIDEKSIPGHDILTAGFPCQAFSIAGNRKGFEDTRGTLFFDVVRVLKEKQPKIFILENVKGLISHDKSKGKYKSKINKKYNNTKSSKCIGQTLKIMEDILLELDYNVFWEILNTKDYGLPQNRERIYFVGFRKDLNITEFTYPKKINYKTKLKDVLENNVELNFYLNDEYQERFIKSLNNEKLQKKIPKTGVYEVVGTTVNPEAKGTNSRHWVYNIDKIISTIDATTYKQPKQILIDNKIRKLTPKECWRLQGFPNEYYDLVAKEISNTQLYKQAGNAVSTNVVSELYKQILKYLGNK